MELSHFKKIVVNLCIFMPFTLACAGPIGDLDSSSRRSVREASMTGYGTQTGGQNTAGSLGELDTTSRRLVREAEMSKYGANGSSVQQKASQSQTQDNPGVLIQNTIDASGRKKCVVSAGRVVSGDVKRGSSVENRTIVTGNIVNVCQN